MALTCDNRETATFGQTLEAFEGLSGEDAAGTRADGCFSLSFKQRATEVCYACCEKTLFFLIVHTVCCL